MYHYTVFQLIELISIFAYDKWQTQAISTCRLDREAGF